MDEAKAALDKLPSSDARCAVVFGNAKPQLKMLFDVDSGNMNKLLCLDKNPMPKCFDALIERKVGTTSKEAPSCLTPNFSTKLEMGKPSSAGGDDGPPITRAEFLCVLSSVTVLRVEPGGSGEATVEYEQRVKDPDAYKGLGECGSVDLAPHKATAKLARDGGRWVVR